MEKWKVIGYRKVNFKGQDGVNVSGYSLFLARPAESPDVVGLECMKLFVSSNYVDYVPVENEGVSISYNRFGKVASIVPCEV